MALLSSSICFQTNKIQECVQFYKTYFYGKIIFDCRWYINLKIMKSDNSLQFMESQDNELQFSGKGIMINLNVENVDHEYKRLIEDGLTVLMPLEDHPWGDRGFSVQDPIGNQIYIYSDREPSPEFIQYYTNEND